MYVYEEMIDGKKLTEIINTTHENVKYLPGHKLPENVVRTYFYFIDKRTVLNHTIQINILIHSGKIILPLRSYPCFNLDLI